MPSVARKGDVGSGHGCWPPRANTQGSADVFANGIAVHRQGDAWGPHTCTAIPETHASSLASGSSSVFANGKQLGRIGDPVACGSVVAQGSGNVFAG
jgi:uncharacterized Zn-binding protein involved in type VI secretion